MAWDEERPPESTSSQPPMSSAPPHPPRPSITLPPRTSFEALFDGGGGSGPGFVGFSPGPMTLVSSFFSDGDDCKSFSQLLAGAMASPAAAVAGSSLSLPENERTAGDGPGGTDGADFRLKQNRQPGLTVAQSPMSAGGLPDSPGLFSPGQGPFGMTHQQALAQVTAQAVQANSDIHVQTEYLTSLSAPMATSLTQLQPFYTNATTQQEVSSFVPDSSTVAIESSDISHHDPKFQSSSVDKPNEDGYNWRKYGQKQVKGSEFPRSYYKCTHPNCPVKKKVERSYDGHITEIIYKGQHNHQRPQNNKRGKDVGNANGSSSKQGNHDLVSQVQSGYFNKSAEGTSSFSVSRKDQESSQATHEHLSGTSDSEEVGDAEVGGEEKDEDEPEPKRRNTEVRHSETASSQKAVTEPRIIVQTTSEVDLLDDGYRWRKYGQKVVKGNPYPRSYYKCTTPGCNVRKHVERASADPKAVITTYEGKHNHDVPASKTSSHNTANNSASNQRLQTTRTENLGLSNPMDLRNNSRKSIGPLRFKEEQIT